MKKRRYDFTALLANAKDLNTCFTLFVSSRYYEVADAIIRCY